MRASNPFTDWLDPASSRLLRQELDDLAQILVELVEGSRLAVGPRKARYIAHVQPRVWAFLHYVDAVHRRAAQRTVRCKRLLGRCTSPIGLQRYEDSDRVPDDSAAGPGRSVDNLTPALANELKTRV